MLNPAPLQFVYSVPGNIFYRYDNANTVIVESYVWKNYGFISNGKRHLVHEIHLRHFTSSDAVNNVNIWFPVFVSFLFLKNQYFVNQYNRRLLFANLGISDYICTMFI